MERKARHKTMGDFLLGAVAKFVKMGYGKHRKFCSETELKGRPFI